MSLCTFVPIGRLGNNLFQAAACIGYAKKHGMQWAIPANRKAWDTFEGNPTPWLLPQFWPNLPVTNGGTGDRYEQHDVKMFNYAPIPFFERGVTLVGFFQSEKWFENAKEEVKAAFPLTTHPIFKEFISIHIRLGDYVVNSNSFPPVTENYIRQAIEAIPDSKQYRKVVFSDDINTCKSMFGNELEYCVETDEYQSLSYMASCSHHIIANSSFSFWGAYLGHNPNKIVISPHVEDWFGPGFTGSTPVDLIPPEWHQIKFR